MADLSLLFDFYGQLLTPHQQKFLNSWCNDDLSFGEISRETGISRQAVYEILKISQEKLFHYEEKLQLIKERKKIKTKLKKLYNITESLEIKDEKIKNGIGKIKELSREIMETI